MAHRMQITLRDDQYRRLRRESRATGTSIAELVRRSLERTYDEIPKEERLRVIRETAGAWPEYSDTGAAFVERMRPGMAARLKNLGL